MSKTKLDVIALVLIIVGGLNWFLFAFGFNLVEFLFRSWAPAIETLVYILVGIAALYSVYFLTKK